SFCFLISPFLFPFRSESLPRDETNQKLIAHLQLNRNLQFRPLASASYASAALAPPNLAPTATSTGPKRDQRSSRRLVFARLKSPDGSVAREINVPLISITCATAQLDFALMID